MTAPFKVRDRLARRIARAAAADSIKPHRSEPSKAQLGQCANDCRNPRRDRSAYCQKCSDRHNKKR